MSMMGTDALIGAVGGFVILMWLLILAAGVLSIIAWWKLFEKAGEAGWKSIIPFYGTYIQFKICWSTTPFWFWLGCAVIAGIGSGAGLTWLDNIGTVASAVLEIILVVKAAKAFGRSGGFAVGNVFLNTIFTCIMAFGSSQYVGPSGIPAGGYGAPNAGYAPSAPQPAYGAQNAPVDTGYVPQTTYAPQAAPIDPV